MLFFLIKSSLLKTLRQVIKGFCFLLFMSSSTSSPVTVVVTEPKDASTDDSGSVESTGRLSESHGKVKVISGQGLSASYSGRSFKEHQQDYVSVLKHEASDDIENFSNNSSSGVSYGGVAYGEVVADPDYHPQAVSDRLSQSCYANIRLEQVKLEDIKEEMMEDEEDEEEEDYEEFEEELGNDCVDEELTSLSWLQDSNLLRNSDGTGIWGTPLDEEDEMFQKENDGYESYYGSVHPPHIPYHPQKHANSKPPYSFSCLIFMAIEDSPDKKLPVKDIYNWILTNFPYFQNAPTGWKNSVRHNLSLNKCFKKVDKDRGSNIGKGSLWMIDPDFRPNLLQALRKTPYHPFHQLQMFNNSSTPMFPGSPKPTPLQARFNANTPSPDLFPYLSRRLAQSNCQTMGDAYTSMSDIDVANTLVSLKRMSEVRRMNRPTVSEGSRSRSPSPPEFGSQQERDILRSKRNRGVVEFCQPPYEDHNYCNPAPPGITSPAVSSSIDAEYDFGADRTLSEEEKQSKGRKRGRRAAAQQQKDDEEFSESDYEEEGWSEEEQVYQQEMKRHLQARSANPGASSSKRQSSGVKTRSSPKQSSAKPAVAPPDKKKNEKQVKKKGKGRKIEKKPKEPVKVKEEPEDEEEVKPAVTMDEEEERRIAEGARALLHLAGVPTRWTSPRRRVPKRPMSPTETLVKPRKSSKRSK